MENNQTLSESELYAAAFNAYSKGDTSGLENLQLKETTPETTETKGETQEPVASTEGDTSTVAAPEGEPAKETASAAPEVKSKDQPDPASGEAAPDLEWVSTLDPEIQSKVKSLADTLAQERKQAQQLSHQFKSNNGRIKAYQQALDAKEEELSRLKRVAPTQQAPVPATTVPALPDDDTIKELESSDPELAKVLRGREQKLVDTLTKHFDSRLEQAVRPVEQRINEDYLNEQNRIVREQVTNLDEVLSTEYWREFKQTATPEVAALIRSPHAKNGLAALSIFDSWLRANYGTTASPPQEQPKPVAPQPAPVAGGVIKARQDRVQSTSATARGAPASVKKPGADFDSEALYKKAFEDHLVVVKK